MRIFEHALIAFFEIVKTEDIKNKMLETFRLKCRQLKKYFLDENQILDLFIKDSFILEISIFEVNYFDLQIVCPSLTIFFSIRRWSRAAGGR